MTDQLTIPVPLPDEHRAADERLKLLIERVERLEEEKKGISDDIRGLWRDEERRIRHPVRSPDHPLAQDETRRPARNGSHSRRL
jgi:hypothetical protein